MRRLFAIELAGALVSDLKDRTCEVHFIDEHASPRWLEPKLFLMMKRTHGDHRQAKQAGLGRRQNFRPWYTIEDHEAGLYFRECYHAFR